jgi:hypothetical protein
MDSLYLPYMDEPQLACANKWPSIKNFFSFHPLPSKQRKLFTISSLFVRRLHSSSSSFTVEHLPKLTSKYPLHVVIGHLSTIILPFCVPLHILLIDSAQKAFNFAILDIYIQKECFDCIHTQLTTKSKGMRYT